MSTISSAARALWAIIKGETAEGANTAARVGAAGEKLVDAIEERMLNSEKGTAGGVATLDGYGKVPVQQMPSMADDVVEILGMYPGNPSGTTGSIYYNTNAKSLLTYNGTTWVDSGAPVTGKLYLNQSDGISYKWNGTDLVTTTSALPYATQAEAEAGTNYTKVMTPIRVNQSISNTIFSGLSTVTKTIIGAINEIFAKSVIWNKDTIPLVCSDEISDLTASTTVSKLHYVFRDTFTRTLNSIIADLSNASSGSLLTIDIKKNGASIFSTLLTIDSAETSNTTALTPYVLTGAITFVAGDYIDVYIMAVGSVTAGKGLKINLLTTKS